MEEEEEEEGEGGGGAGAQDNRGGVRYITEELLLKLTGSSSLSLVRSLNLSSSSGDKRFKFIENLHGCHSLQVLNLNHNLIQRMERLSVLTQLRELQLAHNSIQRIEGLELLSGLQQLNLSYNRIEHVPVWLGKKLHSLHTLHLQHNLITSLYEVSRLRSLSSLSELSVSGNPASSLPHSRLFLLYHLRTLDRLDDLPVTQEERGHAHQRFSAEELQRLQREVDSSQSELSRLQREQQVAVTRLYQQEETNRSLTARTQTQQHTHSLLEQELHTKNQLLEKTMGELTRAFNRLYELEQELTFYKIDAKLSPLPAWSSSTQEVDAVDSLTESPYIGKARLIRNIAITSTPRNSASSSSSSSSSSPQTQEGSAVHPEVECVRPLLDDCITQQSSDDVDLLLTTNQHKQQLDAEHPRPPRQQEALCRLLSKLSGLEELRGEADETRRQMDRQSEETRTAEREMEELETQLLTLDTTDPQQAHVTSQLSSCRQLLGMMSRKQSELEGRLDDLLSRIARETQEIKELEQQLTDGQILANESLQKELEEVISGLQVYLRGLRLQAHRSQQQVHTLQAENQNLQLHLEDTQRHCRQLEDTARTHTQNMSVQQGELSVLQVEAQALRDRQVESSRQQAELEAELQQLREELSRQVTLGQLERGALQDAADKERQSREVRESELQSTIDSLQDDRFSLKQDVHRLQVQLDQSRAQHMETRTQLDQFTAVLSDLQSEAEELNGEFSPPSPEDMLSRSVEQLYRSIQETRTRTRTRRQNQDHTEWLEARLLQDSELQRLRDEMQTSESRNRLIQQNLEATLHQSRLQLQDVQQERDSLLQQLRSQSDDHHRSLGRLSTKLRQLGRSVSDADQLTAEQLKSTTDQLRALNQSVELLHAQKSVDEPDDDVQQDRHTHTVEELKVELTKAHRETHRLRQKLDRTRTRSRTRSRSPGIRDGDGGRWWFVPPGLSAPSLGSQGTQDSGLGLQYFSSPERGRQQDGPPAGGYWVYVPPTHTDSESGGSSSGGTPPPPPPPPPPPGIPDGLTPLVSPGWLLCGPAPAGGAALHCNIPEHRDPQGGRVCECEHRETERVKTKRLRHTLRQDRSVLQVCDEVQCVEKTLLRRRAELRRADRLLLEAQSCIHTCREQASAAQLEADVLQHRAQDSATCLQEATQHVREVEEEVQQLRRRKQQEEQTLREVEEERRSREEELQQLGTKIHSATDRLAAVLSDCEEAQTRLDSLSHQVEQQEQRLLQRREELRQEEQRLNSTVQDLLGQQEALLSQRRSTMSGVREEEAELVSVRAELSSHRADLRQVLQELLAEQQALEDVKNKRTRTLQQLHKKKDELDRTRDELDRTRDELDRTKDDLDRTKDELDRTMEELDRTKDALDRTKDELDRTKDDLDGTKDDLDRTKDELDRTKDDLDRTKDDLDGTKDDLDRTMEEVHQRRDELDGIQDRVERKREELAALQQQVESHRKEAESCDRDTKHLLSELQEVQEELSRRKEERSSLKEQCKHLEARRSHADRCLTAVEAELAKQREEHGRAQLLKQEAVREAAASQQQLHESSELLSLVGERVEQREQQLEELDTLILNKQTECGRLEDVQAAVTQLEDRGRRLTEQQLQLHLLREEVTERENQLLCKEEELKQHREELRAKEEGLHVKEEELHVKEEELQKKQDELCVKEEKLQEREGAELHRTKDDSEEAWSEEDGEGFYWSTAGPRSTSSSEEQRWEAELQREKLKQHEDRLKARLRCRLWNQEEVLEGRSLEAEESLHELKQRLDQLDSLLRP